MSVNRRGTRRVRSRHGQAALLMTLTITVTLGLIGLVVDVGWAYWRREACKTAAQAAAYASVMAASGATNYNSLPNPTSQGCPATPATPPASNIDNACLYAMQNGFVNAGRQSVVVSAGTGASPVAGVSASYWVSVTVSEHIPQLFSAVLGNRWATVSARGTGAIFAQPAGACIYALDPSSASAVDVIGNPDIEAGCGIWVDSSSGSAMTVGGSATVNASTISIVGGYSTRGNPSIHPTPRTGQPVTADPFANVATPNVPNRCDSTSGIPTGGPIAMPSDGFYVVCGGGFTMNGNPTVDLPAGTYVFKSGSIDLHNGTLTGDGVTFYLTGSFNSITINGNVDINLSAPTSGPTRGLLFFQDRSMANGSISTRILGASNTILNGSLYFPTNSIEYCGGSDNTATYTAIVAWDIQFHGNSYLAADPAGAHTGLNVPTLGYIE